MTLPADDRDILDRISADLAAEEPHLTGMYRVFSRLTNRDLIPDEDAVRRLPRRPAVTRGYGRARSSGPAEGGLGGPGPLRRVRPIMTGRQARILAIPALLLAVLITIIAFTAGGSPRCTRAASLHGGLGMAGASCPTGASPPANRRGAAG
jgi:hypothetical protein